MTGRLPQNYIPINYDLYLHIVESQYAFEASVTITFQKNKDSDILSLNVDPLIVIQKITQDKTDLKFTVDYPILTIERSKTSGLDFDSHPITIEYKVSPNFSKKQGFFICNGNYLTDFEPTGARSFLPCFDEPCNRSTFSIKLLVPSYLTALSNMPIDSIVTKDIENELTFSKTPPMCSYLLCLCIGTFSSIMGTTKNGTMVEFFTNQGREELLYEYLDVAIYSLNWLETKFGVKYELPHLQLLSIDGFPGGMENYGLITLDNYTKTKRNRFIYNKTVVMHEIAHQWFGDLVCVKYWDSLWLNEGFAEFIQYLILKDYQPELNVLSHMFPRNEISSCFHYFKKGVIVPSESEVNFGTLFNSLVYSKGAYVLKMFYDLIGEESFYKVCSNYLNEFKNKCADVNDFISIVNSTLKHEMNSFFNPWLKNVGFPALMINEIENENEKTGISITQICDNECVYHFKIPILYEKDGVINKKEVIINDCFTMIDLNFDWIIVNDEIASLCFVVYTNNLLNSLRKPINDKKISSLNVYLITQSVDRKAIHFLIDDEMIQLSFLFKQSLK